MQLGNPHGAGRYGYIRSSEDHGALIAGEKHGMTLIVSGGLNASDAATPAVVMESLPRNGTICTWTNFIRIGPRLATEKPTSIFSMALPAIEFQMRPSF